jgi:stage III sporulation protein AH
VVESEDALEETKTQALRDMAKIAEDIRNESNVEALVKAKGFEACVAVLSGDKISVIVRSDEQLAASQVAQINEIVYSQTGIAPSGVNIIQK